MAQKTKFFHATRSQTSSVGDGTVGALLAWLKKYVDVLFPENGIEYWSDNQYGGENDLKPADRLPGVAERNHVACYVRQGRSEGLIICVDLVLRDGTLKPLSWVKTFGSEDESWLIARAVSAALESILFWEDLPEIVSMADKLPRKYSWHRESSLAEVVAIAATDVSVRIATPSGILLEERDWSGKGESAKYYVEAIVADWKTVLTNMKVSFAEGKAVLPASL